MFILSIDCAGSGCGVCLWQDGAVLSNMTEAMERGQDQRLMPMIMEALRQAKVTFDKLDRIAVTRGPGSFTGLRIGLAAARGIGLAAGKSVMGIDRFSIYRESYKATGKDLFVILNSRRKELYCRFYPAYTDAHDATMMTHEEIAGFLKEKNGTVVTGDIAPDLFPDFQPLAEAEHIIGARLTADTDPHNPDFLPRPFYLRAPDVTMPKNPYGAAITMRPLVVGQANQLAALHHESFGKASWSLQQIQSSLALETTRGWGLFEGDRILGFILCQLIPDQSEVLAFCVHPSQRSQGWGEKLLRAAADAASKAGSHLYLEVAADNVAALALYKKLGFKRTGYRPRYYRIGATNVDAVLMTLSAPDRSFASGSIP